MQIQFFNFTSGPFNQGYLTQFKVMGTTFYSAEQYMMAYKALIFGDTETYDLIMKERDYEALKALGRQVKGFDKAVWGEHCDRIVYEANKAKFTQNMKLCAELIGTEGMYLDYISLDPIWGTGTTEPPTFLEFEKNGKNKLGIILMNLRKEIIDKIQK